MTFDEVRAIARKLPEAEEGTSYGTPALKVRKKLICRLRDEGEVLALRTEPGVNAALIAAEPNVYFTTPHYDGYDYVLVRLARARPADLAPLLADAWALAAPKKLRDAHLRGG